MDKFIAQIKERVKDPQIVETIEPLLGILTIPDETFDAAGAMIWQQSKTALDEQGLREKIASFQFFELVETKKIVQAILESVLGAQFKATKKEFIQKLFGYLIDIIDDVTSREKVSLPIELIGEGRLPTYANEDDGCADIYAAENITIKAGEKASVSTGIKVAVPKGWVMKIYPRSGLSLKTGLRFLNCTGIIDAGYRGEVRILLGNVDANDYEIKVGDRIAQMELQKSPKVIFESTENVDNIGTNRGGGLGSTGV